MNVISDGCFRFMSHIEPQRGDPSEFALDASRDSSVEVIIRQGHGIQRIARVRAELSDLCLWGVEFEPFMVEVGLACRRGLGR